MRLEREMTMAVRNNLSDEDGQPGGNGVGWDRRAETTKEILTL